MSKAASWDNDTPAIGEEPLGLSRMEGSGCLVLGAGHVLCQG